MLGTVGRNQGCWSTSYRAQDGPTMPLVLRSPALDTLPVYAKHGREGSKLKESTKEEMNQKGHSIQDNIPGFSMPQLEDHKGKGPHKGGLSQNT